jgi:hypothetical protein
MSSGMLHCVAGYKVPGILKDCSAFQTIGTKYPTTQCKIQWQINKCEHGVIIIIIIIGSTALGGLQPSRTWSNGKIKLREKNQSTGARTFASLSTKIS